ncbi:MAG TPA: hypothetical protein VFU05_06320, partial [Cyclobacteriaceae bacterium]|nr:hypothetical protein [Cyclobacteriaceae bacterium]
TQTATAVGFTNVDALTGTKGSPSQGSDQGVFPDFVEQKAWSFANGNRLKFTGLDNAKTYKIYVLFNSQTYEPGVSSFTVNGNTSAQITQGGNVGDAVTYTDWETDPALASVSNLSPVSGELTITLNVISGSGAVVGIVLKQL